MIYFFKSVKPTEINIIYYNEVLPTRPLSGSTKNS